MIDAAVWFALLSLVLGGLNEVVFKRYSGGTRSRGMLIAGVGCVWLLLLAFELALTGGSIDADATGLGYALAAGIAVALANILLLEGLRHMEVSLGSTIYRLNTIAVVILAVVFLGESLPPIKIAGIACGILAVILLYRHHQQETDYRELKLGLSMVLVGALLRALYGIFSKAGLQQGVDMDLLLITGALCWIISGLVYARLVEKRYAITRVKIIYASVSGLLVYGIVRSLLAALELGEASVVITIANLSFLMALLVALVFGMERLNLRKLLAMGLAVAAIMLLARV